MKTLSIIIWICKISAMAVLYATIVGIGDYLLENDILSLKYHWCIYPYYFGIGALAYYPCNAILKHKNNMKTIEELKNHLKACSDILETFIQEHKLLKPYIRINNVIHTYTHGRINLTGHLAFYDLTMQEVDELLSDLYEDFRKYLEVNKIDYPLHIKSICSGWQLDKIEFKFEITN